MKRNEPFAQWVKQIGAGQAAERLGVSVPAVYHWCSGRRRISAELAVEIERVSEGALSRADLRPDLFSRPSSPSSVVLARA